MPEKTVKKPNLSSKLKSVASSHTSRKWKAIDFRSPLSPLSPSSDLMPKKLIREKHYVATPETTSSATTVIASPRRRNSPTPCRNSRSKSFSRINSMSCKELHDVTKRLYEKKRTKKKEKTKAKRKRRFKDSSPVSPTAKVLSLTSSPLDLKKLSPVADLTKASEIMDIDVEHSKFDMDVDIDASPVSPCVSPEQDKNEATQHSDSSFVTPTPKPRWSLQLENNYSPASSISSANDK